MGNNENFASPIVPTCDVLADFLNVTLMEVVVDEVVENGGDNRAGH